MTGDRRRDLHVARRPSSGARGRGFTLLELLVVMAIIATLLTVAVPRYIRSVQRSREAVLLQDLAALRESIDRFYGDTGKYPPSLAALVEKRYLRSIPVDPIAQAADRWIVVNAEDPEDQGVKDVRSGAEGVGENGIPYGQW
jgi:general secretion pathway protein G